MKLTAKLEIGSIGRSTLAARIDKHKWTLEKAFSTTPSFGHSKDETNV
jgi:hypothetical protein